MAGQWQKETPATRGRGFCLVVGLVPGIKGLLTVRDAGVLASCEALRAGARSGG